MQRFIIATDSILQVSASTECKCDTDMTTCVPPDGAIDCRTCSVNYLLKQDGSFVCVKQCPSGYFGSRNLLRCVPCANITEHCSTCSSAEGGAPQCDTCESPYKLRGNECDGPKSTTRVPTFTTPMTTNSNTIFTAPVIGSAISVLIVLSVCRIIAALWIQRRRRVSTSISKENVNMSFIIIIIIVYFLYSAPSK